MPCDPMLMFRDSTNTTHSEEDDDNSNPGGPTIASTSSAASAAKLLDHLLASLVFSRRELGDFADEDGQSHTTIL